MGYKRYTPVYGYVKRGGNNVTIFCKHHFSGAGRNLVAMAWSIIYWLGW